MALGTPRSRHQRSTPRLGALRPASQLGPREPVTTNSGSCSQSSICQDPVLKAGLLGEPLSTTGFWGLSVKLSLSALRVNTWDTTLAAAKVLVTRRIDGSSYTCIASLCPHVPTRIQHPSPVMPTRDSGSPQQSPSCLGFVEGALPHLLWMTRIPWRSS